MSKEIHLFIIWEKARYKENEILLDLKHNDKITVLKTYEIKWNPSNFSKNLSRFYGQKLPIGSHKEKHCGKGEFLLIVVEVNDNIYEVRNTSKGALTVNRIMFDLKTKYRDWTGGGHKIHATNDPVETNHDITLLLGKNEEDFLKSLNDDQESSSEKLNQDLIGTDGWKDIEEFFYVLNSTINYVVLRNFECLPKEYHMDEHGDIDLLTDNYIDMCFITNAKKVFKQKNRVHQKVIINNEAVLFDFRFVGDDYYDQKWQEEILRGRKLVRGFYTPDEDDYIYSLIYHALIHKKNLSKDYKDRIEILMHNNAKKNTSSLLEILKGYMHIKNYKFVEPIDISVFYNYNILKDHKVTLKRKVVTNIRESARKIKRSLIKS
ncbi:hypothetical protein [Shouchella lehensis]|uniref:Uncharacterized protein n=1 Tax=Shouchella lehensis G1 TaxID=1246626 RepID=A0A060LXY5_9BACI|nr:hypothetical protein [Shouchella lehensis]AIC96096.1 hypothetical protein BleG1_3549 [Shouchella lehensis G1]